MFAWRARACRGAGVERVARFHRVLFHPEHGGRTTYRGGQAVPARRSGAAGLAQARRQPRCHVRGRRHQREIAGGLRRDSPGPVSRRAGHRGGRRAGFVRRLQGGHRACQARRDLHAQGSRRRAEEAGTLEGRLWRQSGRRRGRVARWNARGAGSDAMIAEAGHYALVLALALALIQSTVPLLGARLHDPALMNVARSAALAQLLFVAASFVALVTLHVTSDFSVANVFENSHSLKPLIYKVTGVWGNHEGSMLLWVSILALFGGLVAAFGSNLPLSLRAHVLAVQAWIASAFYLFILVTSNPFLRIPNPPIEGRDLNPVLQDIGLAVHPPMLYLGYVGFSISFSFAIAALLEGRIDAAWARWVRPWTLMAWICLTLGIAMGSYWAYYELGWGGWWFWDPVENASLMPWLAGTALLHSAVVVEKRETLQRWTVLLAILTFGMSLIGTFLVRSGVLTSVHSFAVDPTRGVFILVLIALVIGGGLLLYALRAPGLETGNPFAPVSREGALVLNNLLLCAGMATVFLGTFYPLFAEVWSGVKLSVGPQFFDATFVPILAPGIVAMVIGPVLAWRHGNLRAVLRRLAPALIGAVLAPIVVFAIDRATPPAALAGIALAVWAMLGVLT